MTDWITADDLEESIRQTRTIQGKQAAFYLLCKKIDLMHGLFGLVEEHKCKDCEHLVAYKQSRTWYKCEIYGDTRSSASDWCLRWIACGLYNKPYSGKTIMEYKKHMSRPKEDIQCDGQISLFDEVNI